MIDRPMDDRSHKTIPTAAHLEGASRRIVDAVNARDWSNSTGCVWDHFAPHSTADATNLLPMQLDPFGIKAIRDGPQHFIARWRHMTEQYPKLHYKLLDINTDLHEELGFARVFVICETRGVMEGVVGQSVGVFEWRCSDADGGKWLCAEYGGMRGWGGL